MRESGSYYGTYFWLSLLTFVVPLFVAIRAFDKVQPTTKPFPQPDHSGVDHQLWDYLLKSYVENGLIDYQGLSRDYLFKTYLRQIASADIDALETREEKLALYCNAYNALAIQGVINHKIETSVKDFEIDGVGFFNVKEHLFANRTWSLNELEHGVIRPDFREPRIHMALVCAAKGCPSIRTEAYVGHRLEKQLKDQAIVFCNNPNHVAFDAPNNQILLNAILDWYGKDFDRLGGYLEWIAERTSDEKMKSRLRLAAAGELNVGFFDYDWSLNAQSTSRPYRSSGAEAGSGTIPNE